MKTYIVLLSLFFQHCSHNNSNVLQNEVRIFDFGYYKINVNNSVPSIEELKNGKRIYYASDLDGRNDEEDTVDNNKDKEMDFVYSYALDDYKIL